MKIRYVIILYILIFRGCRIIIIILHVRVLKGNVTSELTHCSTLYTFCNFFPYYFSVIPRFKKNRRIVLSTLEHVKEDKITFNVTKNEIVTT